MVPFVEAPPQVRFLAAAGFASNGSLQFSSSAAFAGSLYYKVAAPPRADVADRVAAISDKADWLEFSELVKIWKEETLHSSDLTEVMNSSPYQRILAKGDKVIALIIRQLIVEGATPYHWWGALRSLTKENPVPDHAKGNVREISRYWVEWGRARYGQQLESN